MRSRTYEETLRLLLDAGVAYDEADRLARWQDTVQWLRERAAARRERWAAHAAGQV